MDVEAVASSSKASGLKNPVLLLCDIEGQMGLLVRYKIVVPEIRKNFLPALSLPDHFHRDLCRTDAREHAPRKHMPRVIGELPVELLLDAVLCRLPVRIRRDLHADQHIALHSTFVRIRIGENRHVVIRKEALHEGMNIIVKVVFICLNSDIHSPIPSTSRSCPIVVSGPWPQSTCVSGGSDVSSLRSDEAIAESDPVGRSVRPYDSKKIVSPA